MGLFSKKNQFQRLLETVEDSFDAPPRNQVERRGFGPGKALKASLIAAVGLAGLTAGSAGISSLRRRREGASDDS